MLIAPPGSDGYRDASRTSCLAVHTGHVDDMTRLRESVVAWAAGGDDAAAAGGCREGPGSTPSGCGRSCWSRASATRRRSRGWQLRRGRDLDRRRGLRRAARRGDQHPPIRRPPRPARPRDPGRRAVRPARAGLLRASARTSRAGSRRLLRVRSRPGGRVHPRPRRGGGRGASSSSRARPARTTSSASSPRSGSAPTSSRLHRFMGTHGGRKEQYGRALVDALDLDRVPKPLDDLLAEV